MRKFAFAPEAGPLWRAAVLAAVMSAAANAALYALAAQFGVFSAGPILRSGPGFALGPVVLVSALAALAGVGVFALLRARNGKFGLFMGIAAAALLVSLPAPLAVPGAATAQVVVVMLMHLVVAAVTVGLIRRWAERAGYVRIRV